VDQKWCPPSLGEHSGVCADKSKKEKLNWGRLTPPPHARGHGRSLREHAVLAAGWQQGNGKSSQRNHLTRSVYIRGCRTSKKRMEGVHSRVLGASGKTTLGGPCEPVGGVKILFA